ncbi:LOW QUALITY PROTEIN: WD repeat and HMG-box DNA-binding protein 1 [Atheta coriaria]|uniref:LOW QUALITY PROTEIN: WD repeat and HMG-box DNA-binding protein 1 n=1 Tax=Dalotia coriaria TaxID=877792 RepID=UPI0031F3D7CD
MEIDIQPLHYGHSSGHTDITYSTDGEHLISGGDDGDIRIWNGFDDADPFQTALGEVVLCTKQKNDHLIVATDNNKVQLVQFPSGERDGFLTRFTAQVNHIAVSPSHNWVAIGSEDMTTQVVNLESKEVKNMPTMKGPILSLAIDPSHSYIAIACGDNSLKIINIENQDVVKEWNIVAKANSFENAENLCRIDFDSQNKYLAYPHDTSVILITINDWSEAAKLSANEVDANFSIVTFSPSGSYIAASSTAGDICIWNIETLTLTGRVKHPNDTIITALCWNPKENGELAFSDAEGYIGLAINCCTTSTTNKKVSKPLPDEIDEDNDVMSDADGDDPINAEKMIDDEFAAAFNDDDDEDNENAVSLEKLKRDVMGPVDNEQEDKVSVRSASPRPRSRTPEPPLQESFMPSSTPEHLDPRYMCWNEIGVIRCYGSNLEDEEEGSRSIEVEFHDSAMHNSMMMANYNGYTMGSISSAALAVANASTINIVPLGSSTKQWTLNAPGEDIEIVSLAASHNLICFGTNKYQIHVCTIYGVQKAVFSVPGPIICTSACGYVLMVAYHAGNWRKTDQNVEVLLVNLEGASIECRHLKSAIGPDATLQWLGFTDVGTPAMMDSAGIISLHPLQSNIWLPFCNTKKHMKSPLDGFFVTAINESSQAVRGVKCKGSLYPHLTPVPTLSELTMEPPFWNMDTEKHQLEANLCTWGMLQVENTSKKLKETALKAFALSAKNNFDQRALELMETLQNPAILNLALKYVNKLGKKRLSEKLIELATKLNVDEDDLDQTEVSTPSNVIKPRQKLVLTSTGKVLNKSKLLSTPTSSPAVNANTPNTPTQESLATPLSLISQQDIAILGDEPKNPFLKSLKKTKPEAYNPLSLTDKFAGYSDAKEKENKTEGSTEKRKLSDTSPVDKSKEKQRKLDKFMFKRT